MGWPARGWSQEGRGDTAAIRTLWGEMAGWWWRELPEASQLCAEVPDLETNPLYRGICGE